MTDQTIRVQISPLGGGGGGGNADSISAEDFLTYDATNLVVGVEDGTSVNQVAYWDGGSWVIAELEGSQVLYSNPSYSGLDKLRDAVDQALFEEAGFDYVEIDGNETTVLELGDEINTSFNLGWNITKSQSDLDALSASGNGVDADFSVIDVNSSSPVGISLNSPITSSSITDDSVQMTLTDTRPDGTTYTKTAKAVVEHKARVHWGNAASATPDETLVKTTLSNEELRQDFPDQKEIDGGGNYLYIAWPKSMGQASKFLVGGLETTFREYVVSVTNQFNVTKDYYVYRSLNKTNGSSLTIDIS